MAYREGNRHQHSLLPSSVEDYVSPDDPVRAYDAFVEALDLKAMGLSIDPAKIGSPAYDPKSMLKLLVYGYSYGVRSSRKLERACHHNLSFMWLVGGLQPDYRSIARFRADNKPVLQEVLKSCARVCLKLGLVKGNVLFVDGSKLRGNSGISRQLSRKEGKKWLRALDQRVQQLLRESEAVDQSESDQGSAVSMPKSLQEAEELKSQVQAYLDEMDREDRESINRTDSEAITFKGRQGSHAGYNVQSVVDGEHGLVVSSDAVSNASDRQQLSAQVQHAESTLGLEAETVCADAGYESIEHQKPLLDAGKRVIVPGQSQVSGKDPDKFDFRRFDYDAENDQYRCPMGKVLKHSAFYKKANKHTYRISSQRECLACTHFGRCTTNKRGRTIKRHGFQADKERLEATYQLPESQLIYKQRKLKVELPFGYIKHNLQANQLLLRGREGARAECSLLFSAFNISRMINLLGGVEGFCKAMRAVA